MIEAALGMTAGDSIERLFDTWQASPTVTAALAICDALERDRTAHFSEIAEALIKTHALEAEVQLRMGEVYLSLERFDDAYGPILTAGRLTPREPGVYRLLGEVLLRQGDAQRAARVFERAVELGGREHGTHLGREWLTRANAFVPLQKSVGARAVRAEVMRRWFAGGQRAPVMRRVTPAPEAPKAPGTVAELAEAAIAPPPATRKRIDDGVPTAAANSPYGDDEMPTIARRDAVALRDGRDEDAEFDPPTLLLPKAEADVESFLVSTQHQFQSPGTLGPFETLRAVGMIDDAPMSPDVPWVEKKTRRRAPLMVLGIAMLLVVLGAGALTRRATLARENASADALRLVTEAEGLAKRGDAASLDRARDLATRATDLAPSEPTAWIARARVESYRLAYVESSEELGTLIARAVEHDARQSDLAFAEVASRIASRDLARALQLVTEHDALHRSDPSFQWVAGLALLRAGDVRAVERFERATEVDPEFAHAEMMRTLLTAIEGNADTAFEEARAFRVHYPDRTEGPLLAALAYLQHANVNAPPELDAARAAPTTGLLGFVPIALANPAPGTRVETDQARALDTWVRTASAPPLVAIGLRLARERGLHATIAAVCTRRDATTAMATQSRALCASSLLLLGRHGEARNLVATAAENDPSAPDVTIVRALYAYERLDAGDLTREMQRLGEAGKKDTSLAALRSALDVLRFRLDYRRERALELADRGRLWGDIIAIDAALDAGDVDTASVLLRAQTELQPAHWVRQLRLARIRGELAEATNLAKKLEAIEPTPRGTYERMMLGIAKNEARELPCSAGPCTKGHIDADLGGAFAQAEKCILAYAKPEAHPPAEVARNVADESSAFMLRLACALAMAKTHAPKAKEYARSVLAGANGDVQRLGELLKNEPDTKDDKPPKRRR